MEDAGKDDLHGLPAAILVVSWHAARVPQVLMPE